MKIKILPVNDIPIIKSSTISIKEDTILHFNKSYFNNSFTDKDGNKLVKIEIVCLPKKGNLKLGNKLISENKEIVLDDLNDLIFEPYKD